MAAPTRDPDAVAYFTALLFAPTPPPELATFRRAVADTTWNDPPRRPARRRPATKKEN